MTFSYRSEFILDKNHFKECYQQTATAKKGLSAYKKSFMLFVLGMVAASIAQEYRTLALFIIVLSVVDALSVYFEETWWVWRQLLSRAANNKVNLTIDEKGIATSSDFHKFELSWSAITQVKKTSKGFLAIHASGKSYLSDSCLSEEAIEYIQRYVS